VAIVIVTADRGLCGAFNTNIIRETAGMIEKEYSNSSSAISHVFCIGKKGFEFFSKRDYEVAGKRTGFFSTLSYDNALDITKELIELYLNGTFDKIIIVYNEFKSIIQQRIVKEQFLPIPLQKNFDEDLKKQPNYIYEPSQKAIFNYLLPKHLKAQMWRILLESNAAELGAKMTAMDNATTNAKELIRTLQIKYNKERQAAITKEILEIVSGANALKESNA
jgi:F-type H+-transporting ATPase subunit gamma